VLRETTPGVQTHFRPFQVTQERRLQVTAAPVAGAQAPTLSVRRLAPGLPVIQLPAANPATSPNPLVTGFHVLIISGSDDFDVTLTLV
jgi:PAB1-binding protein PBP1